MGISGRIYVSAVCKYLHKVVAFHDYLPFYVAGGHCISVIKQGGSDFLPKTIKITVLQCFLTLGVGFPSGGLEEGGIYWNCHTSFLEYKFSNYDVGFELMFSESLVQLKETGTTVVPCNTNTAFPNIHLHNKYRKHCVA